MNLAEWWPWALLGSLGATALVALLYRRPDLKPGWRVVFVLLRGVALTLIALLFADLACQTEILLQSPTAGLIIDESASMSLADSAGLAREWYARELAEDIRSAHPELDWVTYELGGLSEIGTADAIQALASRRPDLSAVVVIGDGGGKALARGSGLPFPVHALVAGKESLFDVVLETPHGPRIPLVGKPALFLLQVRLAGRGPAETVVRARAREVFGARSEVELDMAEMDLSESAAVAEFRFTPPRQGWWLIEFETPTLEAEATPANNGRNLLINVRRGELTALVLAGEPGPESSFLYRALRRLAGIDVELLYRRPDGIFYDPDGNSKTPDLASPDALFLVDFVPIGTVLGGISRRVADGRGVGLILGKPGLSVPPNSALRDIFLTSGQGGDLRLVEGQSRVVQVTGQPFSELVDVDLPALVTYPEGVKSAGGTGLILANPAGRRVPGAILASSGAPRLLMLGRGWWRWGFATQGAGGSSLYDDLVADLFAYLSSPPTHDRLTLSLDRRRSTVGRPVGIEITGGGDGEPACSIRSLEDGKEFGVELNRAGEGSWRGGHAFEEVGTYIVRAELDGLVAEEPLIVEPDFSEFTDLAPDEKSLARLASVSGGRLLEGPRDELPLGPGAALKQVERRPLRASPWLLGALILLIVGEWFLRRRKNLR